MSPWNIIEYEVLDSTNLEAGRLVERATSSDNVEPGNSDLLNCAENCGLPDITGTVILAKEQTAGRGRRGRKWSSPPGENLYFSLIVCPNISAEKCSSLTLVMGLAVARSIRKLTDTEALIKWPNDIVIDGRKVCGILSEMIMDGTKPKAVIVGVGINVGDRVFPPELTQTATSLEQQCGWKASSAELLEDILDTFSNYYQVFCRERSMHGLLEEYNSLLANRDRQVCVLEPTGNYNGVALGINEQGELLVELPDGRVNAVYAGEVSVRGIYGYV